MASIILREVGAIRYNLTLVTGPTVEPLTIAQVVEYLHIDTPATGTAAELFLTALIKTARKYCESVQRRAYITQTWRMTLDRFPHGEIEIPKGNLQSITSIKYTDSAGTETTLTAGADYIVTTDGILGKVAPPYGKTWPAAVLYPLNPISIEYDCGYGDDAEDVPEMVTQAMYMLISHWHTNRMTTVIGTTSEELQFAVKALLQLDGIEVL
jgi:uncharacterized phiE125 gp8 family phage protein